MRAPARGLAHSAGGGAPPPRPAADLNALQHRRIPAGLVRRNHQEIENLVSRTGDDDGFVDNGHDLSRFRKCPVGSSAVDRLAVTPPRAHQARADTPHSSDDPKRSVVSATRATASRVRQRPKRRAGPPRCRRAPPAPPRAGPSPAPGPDAGRGGPGRPPRPGSRAPPRQAPPARAEPGTRPPP